jgi:hypothetical protein
MPDPSPYVVVAAGGGRRLQRVPAKNPSPDTQLLSQQLIEALLTDYGAISARLWRDPGAGRL